MTANKLTRTALPNFRQFGLAVLLAIALPAAQAAKPISEDHPIAAQGTLEVSNDVGRIEVIGSDRADVALRGELGDGVEAFTVDVSADRLKVHVRYPKRNGVFGRNQQLEPTMLRIEVPQSLSLELEAVSADITVEGMRGGDLKAESVSGDVNIAGAYARVDVESVSGDLRFSGAARALDVDAVSGDIDLRNFSVPAIAVETVSGDIAFEGGDPLQSMRIETVSGNADIKSALAADADVRAESVSGDLNLTLSPVNAKVSIETFSGSITSSVGKVVDAGFGPGASLEATAGDGQGRIQLETFSGDITLR